MNGKGENNGKDLNSITHWDFARLNCLLASSTTGQNGCSIIIMF